LAVANVTIQRHTVQKARFLIKSSPLAWRSAFSAAPNHSFSAIHQTTSGIPFPIYNSDWESEKLMVFFGFLKIFSKKSFLRVETMLFAQKLCSSIDHVRVTE
jgi:hypothetical protein